MEVQALPDEVNKKKKKKKRLFIRMFILVCPDEKYSSRSFMDIVYVIQMLIPM